MSDKFIRFLLILREIPTAPRFIDVATLAERLSEHGIHVTRRTVQRDLERMSRSLPLVCKDGSKPYGWTWSGATGSRRESLREVAARAAKHLW